MMNEEVKQWFDKEKVRKERVKHKKVKNIKTPGKMDDWITRTNADAKKDAST